MSLTLNRYKSDNSYIIEELTDKVKIDYSKVHSFKEEMLEQRGNNDMGNIILNFFERDDNYGTRLGAKKEIMSILDTEVSDFDFLVLAENEMGFDNQLFYKSEFVARVLQKVENKKNELLEKFHFPFPECFDGITSGLDFVRRGQEENELIIFRYDN